MAGELALKHGFMVHTGVSWNKSEHIQCIGDCSILISCDGFTDSALGHLQNDSVAANPRLGWLTIQDPGHSSIPAVRQTHYK